MAHKIVTGVAVLAALGAFASPFWATSSVPNGTEGKVIVQNYGAIFSMQDKLSEETGEFETMFQIPTFAMPAHVIANLTAAKRAEYESSSTDEEIILLRLKQTVTQASQLSLFGVADVESGFVDLMLPTFIGACIAVLFALVSLGLALTDKLEPLRITAAMAAVGCFTAFGAYLYVAVGTEGMQIASELCEESQTCESNPLGSATTIGEDEIVNNVVFAGPILAAISGLLFIGSAVVANKNAEAYSIDPYGAAN